MKKTILTIAVAATLFTSCTDRNCTINGNITGLDGEGWIYVEDAWGDFKVIDSTRYNNGVFTLEMDKVIFETSVTISYSPDGGEDGNEVRRFLLEPGTILIEGDLKADRFSGATGTAMNELFNSCRDETREFYRNLPRDVAKLKADSLTKEIFTKDITPAFRLYFVNRKMMDYPSALLLDEMDKLPQAYLDLDMAQQYKNVLTGRAKTEPQVEGSDIIPYYIDFETNDLNGNLVRLKDVVENPANKYVLLDFWATWCGPCRDEMPNVIKAYDLYKDKGLEIIGIAVDDKVESCRKYISNNNIGWINVCDDKEHDINSIYGVWGIPDNVLIDCKTGIIIGRDLRGKYLDEELNKLMK